STEAGPDAGPANRKFEPMIARPFAALLMAAAAATLFGCSPSGGGGRMRVGFAQIGSESGWRAAETNVAKQEAAKRGIDLSISDAQQRQENEIRAIKAFIAQR